MRLHPIGVYLFGAVVIWPLLLFFTLEFFNGELEVLSAAAGGIIALIVVLTMRIVEWIHGEDRLAYHNDKKLNRLKSNSDKHLGDVKSLRNSVRDLKSRLKVFAEIQGNLSIDELKERVLGAAQTSILASSSKGEMQELSKRVRLREIEVQELNDRIHSLSLSSEDSRRELESEKLESGKLQRALNLATEKVISLTKQIDTLSSSNSSLEDELQEIRAINSETNHIKAQLDEELRELKLKLGKSARSQDDLLKRASEFESELSKMKVNNDALTCEAKSLRTDLEYSSRQIEALQARNAELESCLNSLKRWKVQVDKMISTKNVHTLKTLLESFIEIMEKDRKKEVRELSGIEADFYDRLDNITTFLESLPQ
ncbi:MAG TPA: hypothetical protein PKA63_01605 [Oligoflexia bacterium]|nr:hypothetical protein [Oligoflexia bacterium]HMP47345.1 hypothetical protein [Oligoflexia bacterium]